MVGCLKRSALGLDLVDHPFGLVVVDFPCGTDQAGLLGRAGDHEPGIDRDAVTADAGAGLQNADPGVTIGEADQFPDVDVVAIADDRELVGERDVDVTKGVLGELGHFGQASTGLEHLAAHELAIEVGGRLGRGVIDAADDAVVLHEFGQDAAGQHALRAMGDQHALADVNAFLDQRLDHEIFGGADRAGALQDHEITGLDEGRDRPACRTRHRRDPACDHPAPASAR